MIGIIVDGVGDHAAFRARYGNGVKVLKSDGPRGHTASAESISLNCKKQIDLLRLYGCTTVAIVTDFEARQGASDSFCEKLNKLIVGCAYQMKVVAFCADQMLENWILADIAHIAPSKKYLKSPIKQKNYESTPGKAELKKLFVAGYDYNEVKHATELFPLVRGSDAAKRSPSFAAFQKGTGLR